MAAAEILLFGLPPYRVTPLQHLLERAKYTVAAATEIASAATLLLHQESTLPLLVLTDSPANHERLASLLACVRSGGRSAEIVNLIPVDTVLHRDWWSFTDSSDYVYLPAQPGTILQALAMATRHCTAET